TIALVPSSRKASGPSVTVPDVIATVSSAPSTLRGGRMGYSVARKHVLVTGACTGIGEPLAVGFAEAGAIVGICARREAELGEGLGRIREHSTEAPIGEVDL